MKATDWPDTFSVTAMAYAWEYRDASGNLHSGLASSAGRAAEQAAAHGYREGYSPTLRAPEDDVSVKEIIRQMLADWDALTEQEREDALTDASSEFIDRRHHSHTEPIK